MSNFSFYLRTTSLLILVNLLFLQQGYTQSSNTKRKYDITGRIVDKKNGAGVSFATLHIEDLSKSTISDINGNFKFSNIATGIYKINIACINYMPVQINLSVIKDTICTIRLEKQSYNLPEVEVMATYNAAKGSNAKVGQTALEYIQPVSIADILLLLPGNVMDNNSLHQFNLISSRQVGEDKNTSLGMGMVADGIPLTNDAMRTQLYGVSGDDDKEIGYLFDRTLSRRSRLNAGMDMRNISTDHLESVEIVRGISSAKDGNLSSGAIHLHAKKGVTPLKIRGKADPLNKLVYAGKGFKISDKMGAIHVGADLLSSTPDVRELLDRFTRITGQANYTNKVYMADKPFDFSIKLNVTSSVNNVKTDELIERYAQTYKSEYMRSSLSFKGKWLLNTKFLEELELLSSFDATKDLITRHKLVASTVGPSSMPISKEPGEHEGIFLPVNYYSDYSIDNKPLYVFSQLNFASLIKLGYALNNRLQYGLEYKLNKNIGEGTILDETRPPYPSDNTFIRPRPNYEIPAMMHGAAYLEDKINYEINKIHHINMRLGIRATHMFNLPAEYALSTKVLIEPRLHAAYTFKIGTGVNMVANTLRLGYGDQNKLPTLDMLYPDKLYRDFAVLNAFYQDPERNYLLVNTFIHNPINPDLKENKNKKLEAGWDLAIGKFQVSVSVFKEISVGGFSYFSKYYPVAFTRYVELIHPVTGKPSKEDYNPENYKDFTLFPTVQNSAKTIKRGIEYRIKIPEIHSLRTSIEINGSYYNTMYTKGVPVMYRPTVTEHGSKYPYVGIYEGDTHLYRSRLNTNIWLNTHIKKFGLVFTNFVQVVWFQKVRKGNEEDVYPSYYMDLDGTMHKVDIESFKYETGQLRYLNRTREEIYYRPETKPLAIFLNIKAGKELGKKTKLSFFVNNIIDFNPHYKRANNTTKKEWVVPFFGAEVTVNI